MNRMRRTLNYETMPCNRTSAMTLVLLGFQGSGKSATGNTILKRKCFKCGVGTIATTELVTKEEIAHGKSTSYVTIVDTPPLLSNETLFEINNNLSKNEQTKAVYAIVIAIGRFTKDEIKVVDGILSNSFMQGRMVFIFTRKNELEDLDCPEKDRLEVWLDTTPTIRKWMRQYKINNYFAIENTSKNNDEVLEIIDVAVNMIDSTKENCLEKKIFRGGVSVAVVTSVILIVVAVTLVLGILYATCKLQ